MSRKKGKAGKTEQKGDHEEEEIKGRLTARETYVPHFSKRGVGKLRRWG